uniref:Uncharacterized protein n=1 Tax=Romanomermis culicivorax TaxID=13658 RepID=A0A915JL94_ROMCU
MWASNAMVCAPPASDLQVMRIGQLYGANNFHEIRQRFFYNRLIIPTSKNSIAQWIFSAVCS